MSNLPDNFNSRAFEDRYGDAPIADKLDTALTFRALLVIATALCCDDVADFIAGDPIADALSNDGIEADDMTAARDALIDAIPNIETALEQIKGVLRQAHKIAQVMA